MKKNALHNFVFHGNSNHLQKGLYKMNSTESDILILVL